MHLTCRLEMREIRQSVTGIYCTYVHYTSTKYPVRIWHTTQVRHRLALQAARVQVGNRVVSTWPAADRSAQRGDAVGEAAAAAARRAAPAASRAASPPASPSGARAVARARTVEAVLAGNTAIACVSARPVEHPRQLAGLPLRLCQVTSHC